MPADLLIPLTSQGAGISYRKPAQAEGSGANFYCLMDSALSLQLCRDPASVLATPRHPTAFWLRVLLDGILTGGQFNFDTALPPRGSGGDDVVAIRSVFQLSGDVVVKVNGAVLARSDNQEILEAHLQWTSWCLMQLVQSLALSPAVRRVGWVCVFVGPLCFVGGGLQFGSLLQVCGILLSLPAHLLLSPANLRYFNWVPLLLGASMAGFRLATPEVPHPGPLQLGMLALFQGGVWRQAGGRCMAWLARRTFGYLVRRKIRLCTRDALGIAF